MYLILYFYNIVKLIDMDIDMDMRVVRRVGCNLQIYDIYTKHVISTFAIFENIYIYPLFFVTFGNKLIGLLNNGVVHTFSPLKCVKEVIRQ